MLGAASQERALTGFVELVRRRSQAAPHVDKVGGADMFGKTVSAYRN